MDEGAIERWNAANPVGARDTDRAIRLLAARLPQQLAIFAKLLILALFTKMVNGIYIPLEEWHT